MSATLLILIGGPASAGQGVEQSNDLLAKEQRMVSDALPNCSRSVAAGEIIVCGKTGRSPYRIPQGLANADPPSSANLGPPRDGSVQCSNTMGGCFTGISVLPLIHAVGKLVNNIRDR